MADSLDKVLVRSEHVSGFGVGNRGQLDMSYLVKSRMRGYAQAFGNVVIFFVALMLASWVTAPLQSCIVFFLIGCLQHRLFFPVHDCLHYSLFPSKTENVLVGTVIAPLIGTSFEAIRVQHWRHHRDFGTPHDPGASDYFVRFHSRRELISFLLGPLFGSILFTKFGDYIKRPGVVATQDRDFSDRMSGVFISNLRSYGVILLLQALIALVLTSGFRVSELWRYPVFYILPLVTVFLFFNRLRMFAEHASLDYTICDYFDFKRPTARTIYATTLERLVLCGSDFNYHHEHHLWPAVPGWQLPRLHQSLRPSMDSEDIRQSYMQALAELWRNLPTRTPHH